MQRWPLKDKAPQKAFLDGKLDVGVRQDDGRVLGIETKDCPQAMRLRMQLLQMIGDLARSDEGQHVHLPGIQQARHDHRAASVHGVDDTLGKRALERLK